LAQREQRENGGAGEVMTSSPSDQQQNRVFLTGATGFVGARLAECLTAAYGLEVHALVRRIGTVGTARLARLPGVRMFYGDICDRDAVMSAANGCHRIIHCATGTSGTSLEQEEATVDGTRNVLDAAVTLGAERVVYFSSCSVHDPMQSGKVIRETSPLNGTPTYARMKILAEGVVEEFRRKHALQVVVLRPTCVWGPFSRNWTVSIAEMVQKQMAFLPLRGNGSANAVFIDNLIDAVYLAMIRDDAVGQTFLINDDEPRTWGELYGGYARFLGVPLALQYPGVREMLRVSLENSALVLRSIAAGEQQLGVSALRQIHDHVPLVKGFVTALPTRVRSRLKQYSLDRRGTEESSSHSKVTTSRFQSYGSISGDVLAAYGTTSRYSNENAKRLLGWRPRMSFDDALTKTCQWLDYAGYGGG